MKHLRELDATPAAERRGGRRGLPVPVAPQLATLVAAAPAGGGWIHEIKFDGYRFLAYLDRGRARLFSRNGIEWTSKLPGLAEALGRRVRATSAVLDGELVALDAQGVSDFAALKDRLGRKDPDGLVYYAFDLLYLDGLDLRDLPLLRRKALLKPLVRRARLEALRYSDHVRGHGARFFRRSCRFALEGSISKRKDAPYRAGRGLDWVKVKCNRRQEFVIAGFSDPQASRPGFGALLLGVHERGRLVYAGRVGTGFSSRLLAELRGRLDALERPTPPFRDALPRAETAGVHWVEPVLVAEVRFSQWTKDHRLRHPSFVALREDKPAREIVHEVPAPRPTT